MKKFNLMAAVIIVSFIIQTSFFNFFNILNTVPNLSLVVVVIFSLMTNGIIGGLIGAVTGLMYDTMIYDIFGIYTLIYFFIGAVIGTYSDDMLKENYAAYVAVTIISTVVMHLFLFVILFFLKYRVGYISSVFPVILFELLFNTVSCILVLKLIILLFDKLGIK